MRPCEAFDGPSFRTQQFLVIYQKYVTPTGSCSFPRRVQMSTVRLPLHTLPAYAITSIELDWRKETQQQRFLHSYGRLRGRFHFIGAATRKLPSVRPGPLLTVLGMDPVQSTP